MILTGIKQPVGVLNITEKNGNTHDIIDSVMSVVLDKKALDEVEKFVTQNHITSEISDLKRLWSFAHDEIDYQEDGNKQYTQYPSNLIWGANPEGVHRSGDCKSKTAFIAACLQVIAKQDQTIDAVVIRFCTYSKLNKNVTHVYPLLVKQGNVIILDAVWYSFNKQKTPKFRTIDKCINFTKQSLKGLLKDK